MNSRGWLGLDTRIWKIASTHLVVDAYNNMYAPLLPLLIPQLQLSLTTAGTLAMLAGMVVHDLSRGRTPALRSGR